MKKILIALAALLVLAMIMGCTENTPNNNNNYDNNVETNYCETADDCACGRFILSGDCGTGNKEFIDTSSQCPDFCSGIDGKQIIVCKENKCGLSRIECQIDDDCIRTGCSGIICQAAPAENGFTTCEWKEEYSCYQEATCGCIDGFCGFKEDLTDCLEQNR